MMSDTVAMQHLHRLLRRLREEWYATGRGTEFEQLVERYRTEGIWPFDQER